MTDAPSPPHLALLAVHGVLEPVCVLGREQGRLVIASRDGTERTVSPQRLYWSGATPLSGPEALDAVWDEVQRLAAAVDLDDAWRQLTAAGPPAEYEDPREVARVALADTSPSACDAVAVAAFSDAPGFRVRQRRLVRETADAVERARGVRDEATRAVRRLELAGDELAARLTGTAPPATAERAAAAEHYLEALIDHAAHGDESARASDAAAILVALADRGALPAGPASDPFGVLVALGVFDPDENLALRRAGLRTAFSDELLAEAERAVLEVRPPRRDLRHLLTVAMDDAATVEVDDAIAVDGERLIVFIADVAAFVRPGSALDREAAARASTLYLPEGKVPMLPPRVSYDAASLRAGVDRPALAFSFEVRPDGQIIGLEVERALIHVDRQLEYAEADLLLSAPPGDDPVAILLARAAVAMDAHRAARQARGAVFLQRSEVALEVADDGTVHRSPGDPYAPGRQLVSELMIATCAAAAQFCAERDLPCIYRTQARPDGPSGGRGGRIDGASQQYDLLKRLKPSVLSTRPAAHFTLAVDAYSQLTSPLRRYADLLMHQQLAGWLRTGRAPFSAGQLAQRFNEIERLSSLVKRVENESRRYWAIRWCEQHPDARLYGSVVRDAGRRWVVEIGELALQLPVALGRDVVPGTEVVLAVAEADARADRLQLVAAPDPADVAAPDAEPEAP